MATSASAFEFILRCLHPGSLILCHSLIFKFLFLNSSCVFQDSCSGGVFKGSCWHAILSQQDMIYLPLNIRDCSQYDWYFCKGRVVLERKDCTSKYSYLCVCRTLSASTRSAAWFVSKVGLSAVSSYFIISHCMWDAGGCLCLNNFLSFYCSTSFELLFSMYHKVIRETQTYLFFSQFS